MCSRIQLCENVIIPPQSEGYIKTYTTQNCASPLNLVEPTNKYIHQGLLIGKTLVDTSHHTMTVSVLNLSNKSVKMKQNATLGTIHPIQMVSIADDLDKKVKVNS